jgi:hypothetical protein
MNEDDEAWENVDEENNGNNDMEVDHYEVGNANKENEPLREEKEDSDPYMEIVASKMKRMAPRQPPVDTPKASNGNLLLRKAMQNSKPMATVGQTDNSNPSSNPDQELYERIEKLKQMKKEESKRKYVRSWGSVRTGFSVVTVEGEDAAEMTAGILPSSGVLDQVEKEVRSENVIYSV